MPDMLCLYDRMEQDHKGKSERATPEVVTTINVIPAWHHP